MPPASSHASSFSPSSKINKLATIAFSQEIAICYIRSPRALAGCYTRFLFRMTSRASLPSIVCVEGSYGPANGISRNNSIDSLLHFGKRGVPSPKLSRMESTGDFYSCHGINCFHNRQGQIAPDAGWAGIRSCTSRKRCTLLRNTRVGPMWLLAGIGVPLTK